MFHTVILVGNLGRDPEMRYTPSGKAVTHFSVACNRQWTNNDGEKVKETIWFNISAWGKTAEVCNEYLRKGRKVLVEGRLTPDPKTGGPRVWDGKNGTGASYEVSAETVRFLSSKDEDNGSSAESEPAGGFASTDEDGIPF